MGTLYTIRSGGTAHPEDSFLQELTDLIASSGVKDLSASGAHLKVVQRAAGANMSVDVSTGRAFVTCPSGNTYPVRHTGSATNNAITANSSGQGRIDAVVVYIDLAASPTSTSDNVAKFMVVAGTPAGSPTAPSDATIQAAVGASNGFLRLANVTVANGESSITNAKITDMRTRYKLKAQIIPSDAVDASTTTYDVSQSNYITHLLGASGRNLAVIGDDVGVPFTIKWVQPSAGGPYTIGSWWANIDWFGGSAITLSTAANAADAATFIKKANGHYDAFIVGVGGLI